MNYLGVIKDDVINGPGVRLTIFVSGCEHHCPSCHNSQSWDKNSGYYLKPSVINGIIDYILSTPFCSGVTISGGDPLATYNRVDTFILINSIKQKLPSDRSINFWLYTGYTYEELIETIKTSNTIESLILPKILSNIDVLVDGRFILEKRDISLKFRGSSNQRIIDINKTFNPNNLSNNNIVLWSEEND